jgi:hypothetical protein
MHTLMHKENKKRAEGGEARLTVFPKPCDCFDLIGGTGTGGYAALNFCCHYYITHALYEICVFQDNRFDAWASSDGCKNGNQTLR